MHQPRQPNLTVGRRGLLAGAAALPFAAWSPTAEPAAAATPGIVWPKDQALPHFAQPRHLDVANLVGDDVPDDERVLFTTLQGLVNRKRPSIYLLQHTEEGLYTWLETLQIPWTERDRWTLMRTYVAQAKGVVIWDPEVPATINVATTLAGVHDAVAASPALADKLAGEPYGLDTVVDLRGRFSTGLEAYTWQFDELWSETTHRMLVSLSPTVHTGFLRDYAVANRAMVFWLEVNADDERALFERMLSAVEPGTPYLGWFASDIAGEFAGTELVSAHEAYVVPADWLANATVFAGARTKVGNPPIPQTPELENKIYVTFTMGEGDNFQYNQHRLRVLWRDPERGSVPINWTTNPLLADGAPAILSYYQDTATPNDCLVAGPSGAGYIYPGAWPDKTFREFSTQTGTYMARTGMDVIQILNRADHEDVDLTAEKAERYAEDADPRGWFIHHTDHTELTEVAGVPQVVNHLTSEVQQTKDAIAQAAAGWDGESPLFVGIAPLAWNLTPTDLVEVAESLGPEYEVLRGDHFFDLARQALELPPAKS